MGKHLSDEPVAIVKQLPVGVRRALLVLVLFFVGVGSAFAGFAIFQHKNPIQVISQVFIPSPAQVFGKPNILVLVEGLDYDYTANDIEFSTSSRSDALWAVNLDLTNQRVFQLSIPRDMVATLPNGTQAKINQAQSDGGVREAKQVTANWLGIPGFDRYVVLRIDATKEFVNAVGGVDVFVKNSNCLRYKTDCTGQSIDYDDSWGHLHIHLKEGMQHLDGEHAVAYMRFRHDWCSDPCRIMRQQQVMHAMIARLKDNKIEALLHANALIGIFRKYVQTDFTDGELLSLANYYVGTPDSSIVNAQVPYVSDIDLPDYGDSLVPDTAARAQLVQSMLLAPPIPQPSPDAMTLAGIDPRTVRVDVENGSGIPGAAKRVAERLRKAGFAIGSVGDAPSDDHATSEIHEHSTTTFAGAKVRGAFPATLASISVLSDGALPQSTDASATTSPTPSDVTVVVGKDLAGAQN